MYYFFMLHVKMPKAFCKKVNELISYLINYFERGQDVGDPILS